MPQPVNHFDTIAPRYEDSLPRHVVEHYLAKRTRFFADVFVAGDRLLDIGCGTGTLGERLAARGYRVTGTDLSLSMLTHGDRRHLGTCQARAELLPFADETFDGAYSVAVLHHLQTPPVVAAAIADALRVVRRGGRVVIWDHNPLNPYWPLLMRRVPQDDGTERLVGRGEVLAAIARGARASARCRRLGFVPDFVPPRWLPAAQVLERWLEALPVTRWAAAHNVVVAEKQ